MPLPVPTLDDRSFQDLVDQAKRMIPRYCPEWTDHNVSDPGVTLIELFAWMTEQTLFRLNQVPEKNFLTFLNLIGLQLEPARPAAGEVTFMLHAPRMVTIPRGTEVSTARVNGQEPVVFMTDEDLDIRSPGVRYVLAGSPGGLFLDQSAVLSEPVLPKGQRFNFRAFSSQPPQPGDAFYLGFEYNPASLHLKIDLDCVEVKGIGIDERFPPPRIWEYWDGTRWSSLGLNEADDNTKGMNASGSVKLFVPSDALAARLEDRPAFWVRCRMTEAAPGLDIYTYKESPVIEGIRVQADGGTVHVTQAEVYGPEMLGISDGTPGQVFHLQHAPLLPRGPGEVLEVAPPGSDDWDPWEEVPDFSQSGPDPDNPAALHLHYTLDSRTGEIRFGPPIRQPDGSEPVYGETPHKGYQIRFRHYRSGGGVAGNVAPNRVNTLKTTIPYVTEVTNRHPMMGGRDPESLEHAKMRGPRMLRSRFRAVTAEDYEFLAMESGAGVSRAYCIRPGPAADQLNPPLKPGVVRLLVVPELPRNMALLQPKDLDLSPALREGLRTYLDERRMVGTWLEIEPPRYVWVVVQIEVRPEPRANAGEVQRAVEEALYQFIHPIWGGPERQGWPFGRVLTASGIYALIERVPGVAYATGVKLFEYDVRNRDLGPPSQVIAVPPDGLVCSSQHQVAVREERLGPALSPAEVRW